MTRWLSPTPVHIPPSFADLNLHPLVAQTLLRRGLTTPEAARGFLQADSASAPFPGIEPAVERISAAIRNKETICVWGDFDVDGQTSTTLLVQTFRALGAKVVYYIPIRGKENHGVHVETLKPILDNGATLIVTCDTGISAHEAVDYANSRGVDVVITDHHDLGETLPNAKAIVNPKLLPANHTLANLAGVGVAYKLAEALITNYQLPITADDLLDLVALGLIADVALLKGETRSLAQKGIAQLRVTKRLGLRVIAELAGTSLETLTEETIGFTFAPRLNALGRLGDANPAVELLTTTDPARARVLAAQIEGLNSQRRLLTSQVTEAAEAQLREHPELLNESALVLSHAHWPGGVVGIVANRLVDRYHKPAILLTESDDGILRGSARSVEGLHITEAIASQKNILLGFGGHPMAAGMSLPKEKLGEFRKGLGRAVEKQLGARISEEPTLQIDAWLNLDETNLALADALEMLAPFGAGNPKLTLASRGVTLKAVTEIGKTREHLRLNVEDDRGDSQSLLWWNGVGETLPQADTKFDVAYSLRASSYRGQRQVTLQFEEFRVAEEKIVEVQTGRLEIRDWRLETGRVDSLGADVLIWAEGSEKARGKSRFELNQANELAIYTTPPSVTELRKALEIIQPKIINVFAVAPAEEKPEAFLTRLAGLCKYTLAQRNGQVNLQELVVAMAARENAVRIGLEWLAAGGQLSVMFEDGQIILSAERQEKNPYLQAELFVALRGMLDEMSAFRNFFATTPTLDGLLHWKN